MKRLAFINVALLLIFACGRQSHVPDSIEKAGETVWIEGGSFQMGDENIQDASPVITQEISGFFMHKYEVTNAQFKEFVEKTGYITQAEVKGGSYVFDPKSPIDSNSIPNAPWWKFTKDANWKHPQGINSNIQTKNWNPVVHISYVDACAYCNWINMRLPTEAEREYVAQKSGEQRQKNIWQGVFPSHNDNTDEFENTSPVGSFPTDKNGLFDIQGNVWEWCADPYHAYAYLFSSQLPVNQRKKGPQKSYDPSAPYESAHVIRGGSFLCSESYCTGYLPFTRMRSSDSLSFEHIGFRCVRDK